MNLLGKLNWSSVPFDQPIVMGASGGMVLIIVLVLSWVTLKGYVPYLWREWLTRRLRMPFSITVQPLPREMLRPGVPSGQR